MDEFKKGLSYTFAHCGQSKTASFTDYSLASLMFEANAFVTVETAIQLCSLSLEDMNYRIRNDRFPVPLDLSLDDAPVFAFRIREVAKWLDAPHEYYVPSSSTDRDMLKPGLE